MNLAKERARERDAAARRRAVDVDAADHLRWWVLLVTFVVYTTFDSFVLAGAVGFGYAFVFIPAAAAATRGRVGWTIFDFIVRVVTWLAAWWIPPLLFFVYDLAFMRGERALLTATYLAAQCFCDYAIYRDGTRWHWLAYYASTLGLFLGLYLSGAVNLEWQTALTFFLYYAAVAFMCLFSDATVVRAGPMFPRLYALFVVFLGVVAVLLVVCYFAIQTHRNHAFVRYLRFYVAPQ